MVFPCRFLLVIFGIIILIHSLMTLEEWSSRDHIPCLYKGCCLTGGLYLTNFGVLVTERYVEFEESLKFLSWNLFSGDVDGGGDGERMDTWVKRRRHVCDFINSLKPDVIGLQKLRQNQLDNLRYCLPQYEFYGANDSEKNGFPLHRTFTSVAVLRSTLFRVQRNGSFSFSEYIDVDKDSSITTTSKGSDVKTTEDFSNRFAPPSTDDDQITASWIEVQIKTRNNNKDAKRTLQSSRSLIFATTQFSTQSEGLTIPSSTTAEGYSLSLLQKAASRTKLLGRKLHDEFGSGGPVIVTGDFGWETNTPCYTIMKSFSFENTMENSRFIFTDSTTPSETLTDYIWHTANLESVLSAVMIDVKPDGRVLSHHRPVLGVMKFK